MPIKACADKLVHEMKMFGKNFEGYNENENENANGVPIPAPVQGTTKEDVTKFTNVSKGRRHLYYMLNHKLIKGL